MIGWESCPSRGRLGAGMEMVQGSDKEVTWVEVSRLSSRLEYKLKTLISGLDIGSRPFRRVHKILLSSIGHVEASRPVRQ
jgi:hypothetical protein